MGSGICLVGAWAGGRLQAAGQLPAVQIRAEHAVLLRLRQAGLPFAVPAPLAARDGRTAIETPAGVVTLCPLIPGVHPDLARGPALERYGRAAGRLSQALLAVPPDLAPRDWRGHPVPGRADIARLRGQLHDTGIEPARTAILETAARRLEQDWPPDIGPLPVQVIHGDLASANTLVEPDRGEVTGLLDFQLCGTGFAVQELVAALYNSPVLQTRRRPPLLAAFLRGYASAGPLRRAEADALPPLLLARSLGSVLWRSQQWLAGSARLSEVAVRLPRLEGTAAWVTEGGPRLRSLAAAASGR